MKTRYYIAIFLSFLLFAVVFTSTALASTASPSRGIALNIKTAEGKNKSVPLYQNSHALLIGVSDYGKGWPDLESIPAEIEKVHESLKNHGFNVVKVMNPTSRELANSFEDFIDLYGFDKNNRLLLFFSGHGYSRKAGTKGYLVPSDAPDPRKDEKGFLRKALNMNQILTWARQIESKHALFLFDSCFSGTIFKTKAIPEFPPHINDATTHDVRQFISAGSAGEEVPAQSVFVPSLLKALSGEADLNGDGYIIGTELGMFMHNKVIGYRTGQTPQYGKIRDPNLDEGDFVFINPNYKPPVEKKTISKKEKADAFWAEVKKSKNEEMFRLFIERYPESRYVDLARIKIGELQEQHQAQIAAEERKRQAQLAAEKKQEELTFWESVKGSTSPSMFQAYLERYPKGKFRTLANLKINNLTEQQNKKKEFHLRQQETQYWDTVKNSEDAELLNSYLRKYPKGEYVELANLLIIEANKPRTTTNQSPAKIKNGVKITLLPLMNTTHFDGKKGNWLRDGREKSQKVLLSTIADFLGKNQDMHLHASYYDHAEVNYDFLKIDNNNYSINTFWKKAGLFSNAEPNIDKIINYCSGIGSDYAVAIRFNFDIETKSMIQTFLINIKNGDVAVNEQKIHTGSGYNERLHEFSAGSKQSLKKVVLNIQR